MKRVCESIGVRMPFLRPSPLLRLKSNIYERLQGRQDRATPYFPDGEVIFEWSFEGRDKEQADLTDILSDRSVEILTLFYTGTPKLIAWIGDYLESFSIIFCSIIKAPRGQPMALSLGSFFFGRLRIFSSRILHIDSASWVAKRESKQI